MRHGLVTVASKGTYFPEIELAGAVMRPLFFAIAVFALVAWDLSLNGGSTLGGLKWWVTDFFRQLGLI